MVGAVLTPLRDSPFDIGICPAKVELRLCGHGSVAEPARSHSGGCTFSPAPATSGRQQTRCARLLEPDLATLGRTPLDSLRSSIELGLTQFGRTPSDSRCSSDEPCLATLGRTPIDSLRSSIEPGLTQFGRTPSDSRCSSDEPCLATLDMTPGRAYNHHYHSSTRRL